MKDNLNIIIVNDFSYIEGGASKVAIKSAIELKKAGYNVVFFSAVKPISTELINNNIKVLSTEQFDIAKDKNRVRAFFQGIWNNKAEKAIRELLKEYSERNTLVHIHSWEKALSTSCIKVSTDMKFKTLITLHDYEIVCPNGGFYNYNTKEICYLKPMSKECILCNCDSRKYIYKIWRLVRQNKQIRSGQLPSKVKNYIYLSQISKKVLKPHLPQDAKFYYVKNPVDVKKEKPVDTKNNNNYIYIGRLSKEKGCLLFAKAAKELNLNATFIGDGELKDEIISIYPKARVTGWLGKNEIKEELKNARVLVFPSLWYEGLPLTVMESLSVGVPVVLSDTCTATEVVKDKETGLWFKRGELEDLKEKIKTMMNNNLVEIYSKNAYENYWENDFSLENHVNQLEKVYKDILERG